MRILGLVGSRRRVGNTEILVKEAVKAARDQGAEVVLIRLSDLYIQQCNGCMACMGRGERCRLEDDMDFLGEEMEKSDGIVLGAPSYLHLPPGTFCLINERLEGLRLPTDRIKMAVSIGTAGLADRAGWVVPILNMFLRFTGHEVVGSVLAISAGPGEVLFDDRKEVVSEAYQLGARLVSAIRGEEATRLRGIDRFKILDPRRWEGDKLYTPSGYCCPFCFCKSFDFSTPDTVRCSSCYNQIGKVVPKTDGGVTIEFRELTEEEARQKLDEHMSTWVAGSTPWFVAQRDKIKDVRSAYARLEIPWLTPPSKQKAEGEAGT